MADTALLPLPQIELAQRSDPGRDPQKQVNEDAAATRETRFGWLAVLCDGMGGHADGREASHAALAAIFEWFDEAPAGSPPREVLEAALVRANARVRALGSSSSRPGAHPGSTVVSALVHSGGIELAHVGDSRAYLIHGGQIFQVTRDHSMVQQMVDAHLLTPAQAAVHPDANKITRALGIDDVVEVELRPQPIRHVSGDVLILCSDGLSDLVETPEILQIASGDPPAQAVGKLVDLANARGGHDNITVVILRARSSASGRSPSVPTTLVATPTPPPAGVTLVPPGEPVERGTTPVTMAPLPSAVSPVTQALPSVGAKVAIPAHAGPLVPSASRLVRGEPRKHSRVTIFVAGGLGALAVVVALVALFAHDHERAGRSQSVNPALSGPLPSAFAPPSSVVEVAPQPLVDPAASPALDAGRLAPLDVPAPSARPLRKLPHPKKDSE